jgi:DNA helicase II / ATP-dependent DNA helicase PcrA
MMPNNIPITIEDIAEIAQSFDCDFSDTHRQEALQCKICRDIQACPGSGKTTLLVAKLAILSKKWRWKDRGICVLSHTNVARQEVEKRLASHPTAYSLLSYPHFIGTIQVFVNRFLALPYLRNRGVEAPTVDNYRHKERILKVLERRKYSAIQTTFSNRRNADKLLGNLRLEFVDGHFIVGSSAGNLGLKDKSRPTYTQLEELKRNLWREQLFRYDEMYSIAWAYLDEYPRFVDALRFRFPWVFIDEMQDTDTVQEDLLTHIFSDDSIVQRFGDVNQAIFKEMGEEGAQIHFPSPDSIFLPDSKRFGKCIANFASRLTAVESQTIQGNLDRADGPHSVFLFDNDTISQVLPAFGHLIIDKYSERIPRTLPIKAVGGRKSPSDKPAPSKFPYCIGDFWPDFCPEATTKSNVPTSFIGYVREARDDLLKRQQWHVAYGLLFDGILDFLRRQQARNDEGRRFTRTRLADALRCGGQIHFHRLQKLLLELGSRQEINEQYWERTKTVLIDVLSPVIDKSTTPNAGSVPGQLR